MKIFASSIALALGLAGFADAAAPKFEAFEVTSREEPKITFQFSASDATADSPVVITVPGRALTKEDRKHRVSLQKHWISLHVPEGYQFVSRVRVDCGPRKDGPIPFCDRYEFQDPATKKRHEFYIYVGNWP